MNAVVLIVVVGIWGGVCVYWIPRVSTVCGWETSTSRPAPLEEVAAADGWLAAMTARAHQGVLGGERSGA